MLVGLAIGLSCGGGGGDDTATTDTTLSGVAYYSGPLAGATVTAWQLVDGERNASVSTTTGEDGSWSLSLGLAYETI
ncbi:MAG: hypothetical protein KC464_17730, partial [Myxococcales bacterium]|nr:hypothetical protein [Myxococcales bacterium]